MLWVMTTADKYEFPLCVEASAEALARKMGVSKSTVLTREHRGRKNGQPGTKRKKANYRICKVEEQKKGASLRPGQGYTGLL